MDAAKMATKRDLQETFRCRQDLVRKCIEKIKDAELNYKENMQKLKAKFNVQIEENIIPGKHLKNLQSLYSNMKYLVAVRDAQWEQSLYYVCYSHEKNKSCKRK